jgi:hypothetical protein
MSFEKKHFYTRCAGLSVICAPYNIYTWIVYVVPEISASGGTKWI